MGIVAGCTGQSDDPSDGGGNGAADGGGGSGNSGDSDFPSQDIEIVVHYGYGNGGYNEYPRLVGQTLNELLPVSTKVTNMGGSSGRIGTRHVYQSDPDGYTHLMINLQAQAVNQVIHDTSFDLTKMTWFPQVARSTSTLCVGADSGIESWSDYVSAMQSDDPPKFVTTSLSGTQTMSPVLVGELPELYNAQKVLDNTIVFPTSAKSILSVKNDDAQVMAGSYSTNIKWLESGDLRCILYMTMDDKQDLPEYASDAETLKTLDIDEQTGQQVADLVTGRRPFCGPPDIPEDRVEYLREKYSEAIQNEATMEAAQGIDRPISYEDSATVERAVGNVIDAWSERKDLLERVRED